MGKYRYIKIAMFLLIFFNVSVGQIQLEIRNNSVVGIGGIIVNVTTLNEAIGGFSRHPWTVTNFRLTNNLEDGTKMYAASQRAESADMNWVIIVKGNIISNVAIGMAMNDEYMLKATYKVISQLRIARLGYPSTQTTGLLAWSYPKTAYTLALVEDNTGKLHIFESIGAIR